MQEVRTVQKQDRGREEIKAIGGLKEEESGGGGGVVGGNGSRGYGQGGSLRAENWGSEVSVEQGDAGESGVR